MLLKISFPSFDFCGKKVKYLSYVHIVNLYIIDLCCHIICHENETVILTVGIQRNSDNCVIVTTNTRLYYIYRG